MAIKLITFDLDDTLWDCAPVIFKAERTFYAWLDAQHPRVTAHYSLDALVEHRRNHFAVYAGPHHDLTRMRKSWLAQLGDEWGLGAQLVEPGFDVFWKARNDVVLYPGVREVLSSLSERYALASITNGNADVHYIGIGDFFSAAVTSAAAGCAKPAAEIFDYTLAQLGVEPHEAVHVGDDALNDVIGAEQHGMRTIWINPNAHEWQHSQAPDATLRSVHDIADAIESWR